jgi:hypothetical protein
MRWPSDECNHDPWVTRASPSSPGAPPYFFEASGLAGKSPSDSWLGRSEATLGRVGRLPTGDDCTLGCEGLTRMPVSPYRRLSTHRIFDNTIAPTASNSTPSVERALARGCGASIDGEVVHSPLRLDASTHGRYDGDVSRSANMREHANIAGSSIG